MIKILNKNGKILVEVDADSLHGADLRCADLGDADLRGAKYSIWIGELLISGSTTNK